MKRRIMTGTGFVVALAFAAFMLAGCRSGPLTLSGRLTFAGDVPAAHVTVAVYRADAPTLVASTVTDAHGAYAFGANDLPGGTYKIGFGQPSATSWWDDATTFATATPVVVDTSNPASVSAQLASGTLSGSVSVGTAPLPGATVRIENGDAATEGTVVATVTTDTSGNFTSGPLPLGAYRVEVRAPGHATRFMSGLDTGAVHIADASVFSLTGDGDHADGHVELSGESTITGTVSDGTGPVGSITVAAYDASDGRLEESTVTAADGTFTVGGLDATAITIGLVDFGGRHATHVVGETDGAYDPGAGNGSVFRAPPGGTLTIGTIAIPGRDCTPDRYGTTGDLAHADLSGGDLRNCDLTSADLTGTVLEGADLTGADLTGNARLKGVDLAGANLTAVTLTGADLSNVDLGSAVLTGVASGSIVGTPLGLPVDWILNGGYLIGPGANLRGATIGRLATSATGSFVQIPADFTGADLTGAVFDATLLDGDPLTGAVIDRVDLSTAELTGVISGGLSGTPKLPTDWKLVSGYLAGPGANLVGADLAGADLTGAQLTGANLTDADLTGAEVAGVGFFNAKLTGVRSFGLVGTPASLPMNWSLRGKSRYLAGPGADLSGGNLTGDDLGGAALSGADFDGSNLTNVDFTGADLSLASLNATTLTGADFTGADLTSATGHAVVGTPAALPTSWRVFEAYLVGPGTDLSGVDFASTNLKSFDLTGVNFTGADLSGSDLTDAILAYADLTDANLAGATLTGADLRSTTQTRTDLTDATLTNADLSSAVLTDTDLSGADLTGALLVHSVSNGIVGTPAALPTGWTLVGGILIPPT